MPRTSAGVKAEPVAVSPAPSASQAPVAAALEAAPVFEESPEDGQVQSNA